MKFLISFTVLLLSYNFAYSSECTGDETKLASAYESLCTDNSATNLRNEFKETFNCTCTAYSGAISDSKNSGSDCNKSVSEFNTKMKKFVAFCKKYNITGSKYLEQCLDKFHDCINGTRDSDGDGKKETKRGIDAYTKLSDLNLNKILKTAAEKYGRNTPNFKKTSSDVLACRWFTKSKEDIKENIELLNERIDAAEENLKDGLDDQIENQQSKQEKVTELQKSMNELQKIMANVESELAEINIREKDEKLNKLAEMNLQILNKQKEIAESKTSSYKSIDKNYKDKLKQLENECMDNALNDVKSQTTSNLERRAAGTMKLRGGFAKLKNYIDKSDTKFKNNRQAIAKQIYEECLASQKFRSGKDSLFDEYQINMTSLNNSLKTQEKELEQLYLVRTEKEKLLNEAHALKVQIIQKKAMAASQQYNTLAQQLQSMSSQNQMMEMLQINTKQKMDSDKVTELKQLLSDDKSIVDQAIEKDDLEDFINAIEDYTSANNLDYVKKCCKDGDVKVNCNTVNTLTSKSKKKSKKKSQKK